MNREKSFSCLTYLCTNGLPPNTHSGEGSSSEHLSTGENDNIVLVISQVRDTRILLKTLLEFWGYDPKESGDLEGSLSIIRNFIPKIILLDTIVPFEANLETIRKIRQDQSLNQIPVIVLSGYSQPEFRRISIAVGADQYLVKPLDFDLLEICLKTNIEKQHGKTH